MFIQHKNVYLLAASRQNCNAASILFFLHLAVNVSRAGTDNIVLSNSPFLVLI